MSKTLPPRPNLEQLKKQAKDLRKAHQSANAETAARIKAHLPRLAKASEEEILQGDFSLQEAQHIIAREYGFKHWEMLQTVVEIEVNALTRLTASGAQTLMRDIDQKELVEALKNAAAPLQEKFLGNMSARVRGFIETEMELSHISPAQIAQAQLNILLKAAACVERGLLDWPFGKDATPAVDEAQPTYPPEPHIAALLQRPLDQLTANDMVELWLKIAEQARRFGILSLEQTADQAANPFLREALNLVVDGTEPKIIRDLLQTRLQRAILPQLRTRGLIIIEGLKSIQAGYNPGIIRHQLDALYATQSEELPQSALDTQLTAVDLSARLRQQALQEMNFDQLVNLLTDLALVARNQGIDAFADLPAALENWRDLTSELMRCGLDMMLKKTEAVQVEKTLEKQMEVRLDGLEKIHLMIITGVMHTQAGKDPKEIAELVSKVGG